MKPAAYIALGSNLGLSSQILVEAMDRLQQLSSAPILRSSLWRSSPVDCPPGSPDFLNAAAGLTPTAATPEHLLGQLQALEREFGRRPKTVLNEPRPLDLDLIAWGSETRDTERLRLPHPRAHLRKFVLAPLADIAPNLILPNQSASITTLLHRLQSSEVIERLATPAPA